MQNVTGDRVNSDRLEVRLLHVFGLEIDSGRSETDRLVTDRSFYMCLQLSDRCLSGPPPGQHLSLYTACRQSEIHFHSGHKETLI